MGKALLSKSTFLKGLQCEKQLYLYKKNYNLKDPVSSQTQAIFDQGTEVGLMAQELFPGGVDASPDSHFNLHESVAKTKQFIDSGQTVIYEATFQFNNVIAALDILIKDAAGWKAYEVKSSTSIKPVNLDDAAIQYYTIVNSGIDLVDFSIVHINNQYVKQVDINVDELFTIASVFDEVIAKQTMIPSKIDHFVSVLEKDSVPDIDIGPQCSDPYDCDFKGFCWQHIPAYSVFDISRLSTKNKFELYNQGIVSLDQIDLENNSLNQNQLQQVKSEVSGETYIDKSQINQFVSGLQYPLYFLDFETINPAVPIYDESSPYQQVVFQYSLHILQEDGALDHSEYLAESDAELDPRIKFVDQLITECGSFGTIIVYNIGFERGQLQKLMTFMPDRKQELQDIIDRLVDLMIPFQKKWYYSPEMQGSYSIKKVLPALIPELTYDDLDINNGDQASQIFYQMIVGSFTGDLDKTRQDLLAYCKLDTLAMVEIFNYLNSKVSF
jgi:hypothetical protein